MSDTPQVGPAALDADIQASIIKEVGEQFKALQDAVADAQLSQLELRTEQKRTELNVNRAMSKVRDDSASIETEEAGRRTVEFLKSIVAGIRATTTATREFIVATKAAEKHFTEGYNAIG